IRNVAWDAAGPSIAHKSQTGHTDFSNYYCSNVPSVANRSAGKMFLGSYSFDGTDETLDQGVSFRSRPMALTGYYKYEADSHSADEAGTVTVEILNGNDVIGRGHMELAAVGDYTQFTLPLAYSVNDREATSLRILFSSSNRPDSEIVTTDRCNKLECCSRGSALTVDNLMFNY
ncbi:MAG: PCMD domain-containing protein, partial [Muribaculaceae bacterium]|nr:PCMD domain-containing protein [Muribaculaceae bacterium]